MVAFSTSNIKQKHPSNHFSTYEVEKWLLAICKQSAEPHFVLTPPRRGANYEGLFAIG
jgi:hypothetical protein